MELELDLNFPDDAPQDDDWFDALVGINQRWLSSYARLNPSFGVSPSMLERNSLWMNTHFQKYRMITSPVSKQAKTLVSQHQKTVLARLRSGGASGSGAAQNERESSTALAEPLAVLMFGASADRCPEYQIESLLNEALELLQYRSLRTHALCSGFAGCVFRFLTLYTEATKRILTLQLLVLLATDDAAAVVHSCKVAAQGQLWQPNMFVYTLQKRHFDNETICDLAAKLLALFSGEMPIASPVKMDSGRHERDDSSQASPVVWNPPPSRLDPSPAKRTHTLPAITSSSVKKPVLSPHRATTTISTLYVGSPSPYSSDVVLPLARPPPSAAEQARRSQIYSTPKEKAVAGDNKRRCLTPNIVEQKREPSTSDHLDWMGNPSPPKSPTSPRTEKKSIVLSEKYSWNPDCINSVSGFEWWWRSLPQHHASLEPTQKLKMVTKAAVRLHTKGEWERAVELYLLALSMDVNEEVAFRLRVNLGCAYEVGQEYGASEWAFRAALQTNPTDPYARFKLGSALKELGKFDEAAAAYEAVLEAYPQAKSALQQLEEARQEKVKRNEAERLALATARTARSPPKPGRRPQSRGHSLTSSIPTITKPETSTESTEPLNSTNRHTDAGPPPSSDNTDTQVRADESSDMVSRIEEECHEKKVDLRATLAEIDPDMTGQIRLAALVKLLIGLCGVQEATFASWLPHDAWHVSDEGVVDYNALLEALDINTRRKRGRDPDQARQWLKLVESIKHEEAGFYREAKSHCINQNSTQPNSLPAPSTGDGPRTEDLKVQDGSPIVPKLPEAERSPLVDELDGYHSVSPRIDAKREKARQDTILRAERARVVARKHLHCVKALQDIATRARQYLIEQYEAEKQELAHARENVWDEARVSESDLAPSVSDSERVTNRSNLETPLSYTMLHQEACSDSSAPLNPADGADLVSTQDRTDCEEGGPHEISSPTVDQTSQDQAALDDPDGTPTLATSLSTSIVAGAVDAATRRIAVAVAVAELQAVVQVFARVVPETLEQLAARIAATRASENIER